MSMIRLQNNTPSEYCKQSRDFQLLCRLYDCVINAIQYDISTIPSILDTSLCRDTILPLLQTKLGFFTNNYITSESLRYVLSVFPLLLQKKGSLLAIQQAVITFLKINNISSQISIYYIKNSIQLNNNTTINDHTILIGIDASFQDTSILEEIFKYILPAGIGYYFYFYSEISELEKYSIEDDAILIYTTYNINAQLRGITSVNNIDKYTLLTDIESIVTSIDYKQDLHGEAIPYPGDGENLISSSSFVATNTSSALDVIDSHSIRVYGVSANSNISANYNMTFEAGSFYILSCTVNATTTSPNGWRIGFFDTSVNSLKSSGLNITTGKDVFVSVRYPASGVLENNVSGKVRLYAVYISVDNTLPDVTFKNVTLTKDSNICPIQGYSNVMLIKNNKNILNYKDAVINHSSVEVNFIDDINGIRIKAMSLRAYSGCNIRSVIFKPNVTYTLSFDIMYNDADKQNVAVIGFRYNDSFISNTGLPEGEKAVQNVYTNGHYVLTYTPTADVCDGLRIDFLCTGSNSALGDITVYNIQLEVNNEETSFEPYNGTIYNISLENDDIVYGGILNIITGELIVDKYCQSFDGTEDWTRITSSGSFRLECNTDFLPKYSLTDHGVIACSHAATETGTERPRWSIAEDSGTIYFYFDGFDYPTKEDWVNFVTGQYSNGTPLQVLYELNEPIVSNLTPTQITALLGNNTLYSDCGELQTTIKTKGISQTIPETGMSSVISFIGDYVEEKDNGIYSDDDINRLLNAVDTIVIESNDSLIPTVTNTEMSLFLGQYEGRYDFYTFIQLLEIEPVEGNIILYNNISSSTYNNDEYVYRNNSWNKVNFFGTIDKLSSYANPTLNDIVFCIKDENDDADNNYYIYNGTTWEVNNLAVYVLFKIAPQESGGN